MFDISLHPVKLYYIKYKSIQNMTAKWQLFLFAILLNLSNIDFYCNIKCLINTFLL